MASFLLLIFSAHLIEHRLVLFSAFLHRKLRPLSAGVSIDLSPAFLQTAMASSLPFSSCFTKGPSSSGRAVESDHDTDGPQPPDEGASEWTTSHEGLKSGEPGKMPGDLEPDIISIADPRDPSSNRCFFMKSGLPKNAFPGSRADCNLMEWLHDREDNGITPLATIDVPGLRTPTYVRDEIRLLIKSLIQFIQYFHNQGRCISGGGGTLRLENIHVVGQNLKFDVLELSSFTEELQDEDYKSVCCMITTTIFKKNTDLLPYDMQHLLKLLMNPRPHVYLISKHVALMNSIACRDFILLLWDKKKTMNPAVYKKWQNSIKDLNVGMYCWADHIHQDSPLSKVYTGGKHHNTSKLTGYQGGKCVHVSQLLTGYQGGKSVHVSQLLTGYQGGKCPNTSKLNAYQGAEYDNTSKFHLIRFFRNAAAHLSDHSCRGGSFRFEHISLIITNSFPTVLPDLQERLHHHGILQEFF